MDWKSWSDTLWVATAAGLGALDLKTGFWSIYDHNNTVMHEPWVYSIAAAKDRVFVGVWGGGILEYELSKAIFKEHRDPDRDFHFDLVPDDGPVNDITSWVAWADGILWQGTYFGMSRYDGSRWRTWQEKKSPLLSNFINFICARGRVAWVGTDRGISVTDGDTWVNYRTSEKRRGADRNRPPGSADGNTNYVHPPAERFCPRHLGRQPGSLVRHFRWPGARVVPNHRIASGGTRLIRKSKTMNTNPVSLSNSGIALKHFIPTLKKSSVAPRACRPANLPPMV